MGLRAACQADSRLGSGVLLSRVVTKDSSYNHCHQSHSKIQFYNPFKLKKKKPFNIIQSCEEVVDQ